MSTDVMALHKSGDEPLTTPVHALDDLPPHGPEMDPVASFEAALSINAFDDVSATETAVSHDPDLTMAPEPDAALTPTVADSPYAAPLRATHRKPSRWYLPRPDWSPMGARIRPWLERFDAFEQRERLLMIAAALAGVVMLSDALWLSPIAHQLQQVRGEGVQSRQTLASLQTSASALIAQKDQERQKLQAELQDLRGKHPATRPATVAPQTDSNGAAGEAASNPGLGPLGGQQALTEIPPTASNSHMVASADMLPLLNKLMSNHPGIKVRGMQSIGTTGLGSTTDKLTQAVKSVGDTKPVADGTVVYRHGVELALEGSYADLVSYLMDVEALPQRVLWGQLQLKAEEHPKVQLTLRLYTLSLDPGWVEI